MSGPTMFLGAPGTGKSKLALKLAREEQNRTGYPLLIVDPAAAWNFKGYYHARELAEIPERLYGEGLDVAYTPTSEEPEKEFAPLIRGAREGERVIILIDELKSVLPSKRSMSLPFQLAVRFWRHKNLPFIAATTQCYLDAARPLKAAVSHWHIGRLVDPDDADQVVHDFKLEKRFGIDADGLERLPDGKFLHIDRSGGGAT